MKSLQKEGSEKSAIFPRAVILSSAKDLEDP
jgi:hypothetical protein